MKILFIVILAISISTFAQDKESLKLPSFPAQILSQKSVDDLIEKDSPQMWAKYAEDSKTKVFELAQKQLHKDAASWLYVHLAAELFAKEGANLNPTIKKTMLSDIPALCDLFESIKKEDYIEGFCATLSRLYTIYPDAFKKYLRSAYAVSLIYDISPLVGWPMCNTVSDPVALSQPEEVFNIFMEDPKSFAMPIDKFVIGELIWVFGVAGPLDELRSLKNPRVTPSYVEKLTTSIKDDHKRIEKRRYLDWDINEREFSPKNIMEYGGSPFEKVYCAWRVANANAIPCLFFSEKVGSNTEAWLTYMEKPTKWKSNVARSKDARFLYARPIDPQTWKTSTEFDIEMLARRHIATENGVLSCYYLRLSKMLYDSGKYKLATEYALEAIKANSENWEAYIAYINGSARAGASQDDLDAFWKKSYKAFSQYPDMCIKMLKFYCANLVALRRAKEADKLFASEMRVVMRSNVGLGIEIYAEHIMELFANAKDKREILKPYGDILRVSSSNPQESLDKITIPLAKAFREIGDYRSAQKVVQMFISSCRDQTLKRRLDNLLESMAEPKEEKDSSDKGLKTKNN